MGDRRWKKEILLTGSAAKSVVRQEVQGLAGVGCQGSGILLPRFKIMRELLGDCPPPRRSAARLSDPLRGRLGDWR